MPVLIWQMLHYFLKNLKVERSVWDRAPHSEYMRPCKSDWCYMEFNSTSDRNHGGSLTRQNLLPDLFDAATDQNRTPNVLTFNCHRQVTSLAIQNPAVDQPISVLTDSLLLLCIYLFLLLSLSGKRCHCEVPHGGRWWPGQYLLIKMVCWARL